jgi:hypothetical protein
VTDSSAPIAWSPLQQRLLRAMGYETLRRVPSAAVPRADVHAAEDTGGVRIGLAEAVPDAGSAGDRLLVALLRAAGLRREDVRLLAPDDSAKAELHMPPMRQLAASAAARRALWPSLRRLRRERDGRPR